MGPDRDEIARFVENAGFTLLGVSVLGAQCLVRLVRSEEGKKVLSLARAPLDLATSAVAERFGGRRAGDS